MTKPRTLRFHQAHGPAPLFCRAQLQLKELARQGLNLTIPHFQQRTFDRDIPTVLLESFLPEEWEIVKVDTTLRGGKIRYMTLRRPLVRGTSWLWIVLAYEHVITAWIRRTGDTDQDDPAVVRRGTRWTRVRDASLHSQWTGGDPGHPIDPPPASFAHAKTTLDTCAQVWEWPVPRIPTKDCLNGTAT